MSPDFERVIGRAMIDPEFRGKLIADVDQAIAEAGFQLTADEIARLRELVAEHGDDDELLGGSGTQAEW